MKKLMTVIAAVATAFGLYAAAPTVTGKASFESTDEAGVSADEFDATNELAQAAGWLWADDPLKLGAYDGDAYSYTGSGNGRRTEFEGYPAQLKYLTLDTGNDQLLHTIGEGSIFVDQLVKFTGFEDAPVFTDDTTSKIAVWMEEADISGDDPDSEATATNLWITAGAAKVPVQIGATNEYKIGQWYRLTIKSLGVIDGKDTVGFVVYIDGQQVGSWMDAAKALIDPSLLSDANKALQAEGKLFPAMNAGEIASVGFKGIGAIDDLVIDDQGPEFARRIPFTVVVPEGLQIVSIKDLAGNDVVPADGVANGTTVKVTYGALPGFKILSDTTTASAKITEQGMEIDPEDTIDVQPVVATKVNAADLTVTNEYAETELYGLVTGTLIDGDAIKFIDDVAIVDGDETPVYNFTADTTINVAVANEVTTWNIAVAGEGVYAYDYVGAAVNVVKNYTFADNMSALVLNGAVGGKITAASVYAQLALSVSGTLTAETLTPSDFITLVGDGKVLTKTDPETLAGYIVDSEEKIIVPSDPVDGWYTYRIPGTFAVTVQLNAPNVTVESIIVDGETVDPAAYEDSYDVVESITVTYKPADGYKWVDDKETGIKTLEEAGAITAPAVKAKTGFIITIGENDPVEYENVADALAAVQAAEAEGTFPIVVKAIDEQTVAYEGQEIVLAKDDQITIPALRTWQFSNGISITPTKGIVLAAGASLTVKGAIAAGLISAPADYKVKETNNGDGTFTYTAEAKVYVAQVGAQKFETLAEAVAAAQTTDTVTLLANVTLDNYTLTKKITLDLAGFNLTGGTSTNQRKIFTLLDGADLTVNGTNSTITGNFYLGVNNGVNAANLTLNGGDYQQAEGVQEAVLQTNGGDTGVKVITATGCSFLSEDIAVYLAGPAETVLKDCDIVAGITGIEIRAGELEVVGTTIKATYTPTAAEANGSGSASKGAGIAVVQHTTKQAISVTVGEDTVIDAYTAFYEANPQKNAAADLEKIDIALNAGTYKYTGQATNYASVRIEDADVIGAVIPGTSTAMFQTDASDYCAVGYETVLDETDNYYKVAIKKVTATFKVDADVVDTQVIDYGTAPTNVVVTKEGYTFTGWDKDITLAITVDTTYTAQFEAIKVTSITLDKSAVTIYVGDTSNVVATIAPADALVKTVEWDYTALDGFATAQVEGNTIKITGTAAQPVSSSPMVIKAKADDVEVTCSISVIAVPTAGPTTDTPGADVEEQDIPGGKIAVVTTTDTTVKEVSISGLGETTTVQVNGQIDSIKGVGAGNEIKVVSRGNASVDITEFCKIELSGDTASISLDPAKAAPVIGEVTIDDKPVAPVSADGTVGFQTKPGLYYTLIAGNEPGAVTVKATEPQFATGTAMKLTADPAKFTPTGAKAFFKVDAAK